VGLSEPLLWFRPLSSSVRFTAFHVPKLLFVSRFILGFRLTKIRARRASGFLSLRGFASARKQAT
jgi:hypothetical protein